MTDTVDDILLKATLMKPIAMVIIPIRQESIDVWFEVLCLRLIHAGKTHLPYATGSPL
jgi:hypothetical protein